VTVQQAESLAEDLRAKRFNAVAFHAGLKAEIKSQIQDDFMASKTDIASTYKSFCRQIG
jgi:superfamily II DNA helicase RecQ